MVSARFIAGISAAIILTSSSAALAEGKKDRAEQAIVVASTKIDAANKVGAAGQLPRMQAAAAAALREAREDLASGHKEQAIAAANRASQLADTALGEAQRMKTEAAASQRSKAEEATDAAQRQASAANTRAESAERAAASAAADAQAARNARPIVVAPAEPAPTTTTVTTETKHSRAMPVRHRVRHVVHHRATHPRDGATSVKTTTTVKTDQ
jgi:hypothetical protein